MTEHACIKCGIALTADACYEGWFKRSKFVCKSCARQINKTARLNLKLEVLKTYGGKCTCCSETSIEFLTIDHIDGKGAEHRKSLGLDCGSDEKTAAGHTFYRWLKKNNFPTDNFQILCFNCNYAKHVYGVCPHKH